MEIEFWEDSDGYKPVWEFIKESNCSKLIIKKFELYERKELADLLKNESAKELKGIKEKYKFSLFGFRPGASRFLFVALKPPEKIFLVHAFRKKTNKTPQAEINKALRIAILLSNKHKLR